MGDDIRLIEAWAGSPGCSAFRTLDNEISQALALPDWSGPEQPPRLPSIEQAEWYRQHASGGSDSFHAGWHAAMALADGQQPVGQWFLSEDGETPRAVLVVDHWAGWYRTLAIEGLDLPQRSRSWRVEVFVRSFGSLGTYRRSRRTGMWFTGQHRWHELGYQVLAAS